MIVLDVHVCFSRRQKDKQGSNDGLTKKKEKERSLSSYCVSCKGESGRTSLFCGGNVITWHDDLLFSDWCDDTWETHIGPDKFFPSVWSRHFTLYFCVWSRKWANRVTARSCCCCFFISLYFFAVIIRILYSLPKKGFSFFFFSLVYINRRVFGPDRMSITRSASFGFFTCADRNCSCMTSSILDIQPPSAKENVRKEEGKKNNTIYTGRDLVLPTAWRIYIQRCRASLYNKISKSVASESCRSWRTDQPLRKSSRNLFVVFFFLFSVRKKRENFKFLKGK